MAIQTFGAAGDADEKLGWGTKRYDRHPLVVPPRGRSIPLLARRVAPVEASSSEDDVRESRRRDLG